VALSSGVVLVRTGSSYRVHTAGGEVTAVLRGRLRRRDDDRVVAGDVVELELRPDGPATISRIHPRRSVLARRAAGERSPRAQPLAANVDQVVVVAAVRDPEPNLRLLDRFLVIAEANRIPPVIVLNKIELERGAEQALRRRFTPAGYQVLPTSVRAAEGLAALREVTFRIIAANASSRSIPCELARQITTNRTSASSIATEPSASSVRLVFSPNRWLISRASSPTSSVRRARLVSGGKYPSLYWPIQRSTVCCASRRDKGGSEES